MGSASPPRRCIRRNCHPGATHGRLGRPTTLAAHELAELRLRLSTPTPSKNKTDIVKFDDFTYNDEGDRRLHLSRWFCEVDIAVEARQLSTEVARIRFLLSKPGGKAKEWALGKHVADPACLPTMTSMKNDLRLAFEPTQDETAQRRHGDPGPRLRLRDDYQRSYLTKKTPSTLEEAFAIDLREDYSSPASQAFDVLRPLVPEPGPEPMEVEAIQHYSGRPAPARPSMRTPPPLRCFRCKKPGHRAAVCRTPTPVVANVTAHDEVAITSAKKTATTRMSTRLSLAVEGAQRPFRALLDSCATNNFVRDDSLSVLPADTTIREGPGDMVVKYADGKPQQLPRRSVSFAYEFDGLQGSDDFLVIELGDAFDCIFGIPWLARHQPHIDWLRRTFRPRDIDVNAVLASLSGALNHCPHVAVMGPASMTTIDSEVCDGPSCAVRETHMTRSSMGSRVTVSRGSRRVNTTWLSMPPPPPPHTHTHAAEQRFPRAVERELPHREMKVADKLLGEENVVERALPLAVERVPPPVVEWELPEEDEGDGDTRPVRRPDRRKPRRSRTASLDSAPPKSEVISVLMKNDTLEVPRVHDIEVASPPCDANEITQLPGLSWKHFLRELKHEPKTAREARYAAQSLAALEAAGNPVAPLVREFIDIVPDKVPAVFPPPPGVRHATDLVPGAKCCVTRQWPLPRDEVEAIDAFFENRRQAGHVRESLLPHSSPTFCVKKTTGAWRIVHAINKLNGTTIPAQTPIS
ncbi:hypothetical protein PPTG_02074 [Phytophthora nicotianae INRA-310]|uniref:CCHC-type domain-containing protein n=1 Tax=Phytophthora nicotianae (strain INRA-310) TaxID=761204 RepID=W2R9E5_PHYN3|nr:hypothetical protein PPTG_02074 [Phytophthora nicotianae INRA-310]ETN22017.1 hypothetical protein PPTG_02074 [Phytophthora nicotianae INRA-310]